MWRRESRGEEIPTLFSRRAEIAHCISTVSKMRADPLPALILRECRLIIAVMFFMLVKIMFTCRRPLNFTG